MTAVISFSKDGITKKLDTKLYVLFTLGISCFWHTAWCQLVGGFVIITTSLL